MIKKSSGNDQGRNSAGKRAQCPRRQINERWWKQSQQTMFFFSTVHLLLKTLGSNMGTPN